MKKTLLAALVIATASFGSTAFAQTTGGTTSGSTMVGNSPQTISLTDNAGFFGDVIGANNSGAQFADKFNFSVTGSTAMSLNAIISSISNSASTGLDVTGLALYGMGTGTGTGSSSSTGTLVASGTMMQSGAIDVWTLSTANLAAGNYYLQVSGNMAGTTAGSFGGAMQMAAPVPEPETYGMMLGGLGLLGFLARRRKAKQA